MLVEHLGNLERGELRNADMATPIPHCSPFDYKPRFPLVLWASPVDSTYRWADWCRENEWGDPDHQDRWELDISPAARIFTVDGPDDLGRLVDAYPPPATEQRYEFLTQIDWRRVALDFDAVHLTDNGQVTTRYTRPGLYGWDVGSLAIFTAAQVCTLRSVIRAKAATDA